MSLVRRSFVVTCILGLAVMPLVSCSGPTSANSRSEVLHPTKYPYHAVATVGMVADLVREIGGDHVEVKQLLGATIDPHTYAATSDDIIELKKGDIVFYNGLMLEGKMIDALVRIGRGKPVYAVTEQLDAKDKLDAGEGGHYDPHVWMNVALWSKCAVEVGRILADYDPKHAPDYQRRAHVYAQQLAKLHEYGKKAVASIPADRRVLITSHDAFNYFGLAYGLDVQGVQGISTDSEAGLQRVNQLVDLIVTKKIQAVFVETSVSQKNIEALIAGAKSRGHEVSVGGKLFSDAMGEAGTYRGTYIGMLDHNITTVTRALGGDAPETGFQGKL